MKTLSPFLLHFFIFWWWNGNKDRRLNSYRASSCYCKYSLVQLSSVRATATISLCINTVKQCRMCSILCSTVYIEGNLNARFNGFMVLGGFFGLCLGSKEFLVLEVSTKSSPCISQWNNCNAVQQKKENTHNSICDSVNWTEIFYNLVIWG